MTFAGWAIMGASVSAVTALFAWCLWKVLSDPEEAQKLHGPGEPTPDERD